MKTYWPAIKLGGLFLMSAALAPLPARAQLLNAAATVSSPMTAVAQVDITRTGPQTTVRVQGSGGRLNYHVTRLSDPPRVVVDFADAHLSVPHNSISSNYEPVRGVRLGQSHPDQVRLVIDLAYPATFSVDSSGQAFFVKFVDSALASSNSISGDKSAKPNPSKRIAEKNVAAETAGGDESLAAFSLPDTLTGMAGFAAPEPQAPAPQAQPAKAAGNRQKGAASDPDQEAGQSAAPVPDNKKYSGEPISVNLKDVDLKDFFRLIHEISGLNVVLDPSVRGTVTLVLDEVPWDQALDIVLRNNGLSKELDGNVLRIATEDTLKREANDKRDLQKAESEAVDPVTITRVLSYAKASELVIPLKRFLTARGDVMAIDRSNTLIIRDIPSSMPKIDNLIRQLDRKTQQVEIQARVVQASRTFARDIGTQFGFAGVTNTPNSSNVFGAPPGNNNTSPLVHPVAPPLVGSSGVNSIPLVSNFPANAPTSGLLFGHSSPNFALDYMITAAESSGAGKLLSSPQLVTQNNAKATVKQGTEIPIQTTINNTISVQYIDAVLKLEVTPQITADGTVYMDVTVENTQIAPGIPLVQGIPALSTQSAQTKVLIGDGGTVVIGGVMVSQQQTNVFQVPLVGSVPIIGHLFKRTTVDVSSQELLFFLTPRILPG